MIPSAGKQSPWGRIQTVDILSEGIYRVTTAGHGGLKIDAARNAKIPKSVRSKGGWYEEDCEWSLVVCSFPEDFPVSTYENAIAVCKNYFPYGFEEITGVAVAAADSYVLRYALFRQANLDKFVVVSAAGDWSDGCPPGYVIATAAIGGRREDGSYSESTDFLVPAEEYQARSEFGFVIDTDRHKRFIR